MKKQTPIGIWRERSYDLEAKLKQCQEDKARLLEACRMALADENTAFVVIEHLSEAIAQAEGKEQV